MCKYVKITKNSKFQNGTKKLVDEGIWSLRYGFSNKDKKIKYVLNTGDEYYYLDINGEILSIKKELKDFIFKDIARFTKIDFNNCLKI